MLPTLTPIDTIGYTYNSTDWTDQLVSYNGQTISYDEMGNPLTYRGYTFGWRGKQLTTASNGTDTLSFEYNEDGLRQQKTVNNVDTNYFYNGSVLIGMQRGTDKLLFSYDASGSVVSVNYNGTEYYYLRNAQGDIVKLIDATGTSVVEYTYDTWGKKVTTTGSLAGTLGLFQPFRYRGYVYDWETGFYYLQSRYYDPTTGRFISADVLLSTGQGVLGHNCYAYCLDNPVNMADAGGSSARDLTQMSEEGAAGYKPVIFYKTMDEAAIAFAQGANYITADRSVEVCAFIYACDFYDFETNEHVTRYTLSDLYIGKHNNVIESYSWYSLGAVGFVHTHPNCNGHTGGTTAAFSWGDCLTAVSTGVCYMSDTTSGYLFKINRQDAISGVVKGVKVFTYCQINESGDIIKYVLDNRVTLVSSGLPKAKHKYICRTD